MKRFMGIPLIMPVFIMIIAQLLPIPIINNHRKAHDVEYCQ